MQETTASHFCTLCMIALSVTSSVMSPGRKPCCSTASSRKYGRRPSAKSDYVERAAWTCRIESRRDLSSDRYAAPGRTALRFLLAPREPVTQSTDSVDNVVDNALTKAVSALLALGVV